MKHKMVLIADDDSNMVSALAERCESLGLTVETASNAMTALGKIDQFQPDAVILDVNMPYGNGLSVCEMMAGHEELSAIPVIMLTGSSDHDTIRRCRQMRAHYVLKSLDVWSRIEPVLKEVL